MAQSIVATKTVTVHQVQGKPVQLIVGKTVTSGQYNKLTTRQQQQYTQVVQPATTRHPYTYDQAVDLVGCYLAARSNRTGAVQGYMSINPNDPHPATSVGAAVGQLRAIDPNHPNDTRWVAKTTIIQAALDTAPDYFDPTGELQSAYDMAG